MAYEYRLIYGNKTKNLKNIEASTVVEWSECMLVFDPRVRQRDFQVFCESPQLITKLPIDFVNND